MAGGGRTQQGWAAKRGHVQGCVAGRDGGRGNNSAGVGGQNGERSTGKKQRRHAAIGVAGGRYTREVEQVHRFLFVRYVFPLV